MGVVWEATELATSRAVALKMLHARRAGDPLAQERILREARAAREIVHPNVIRVEAVLETDAGSPLLVMELLKGESLRALLARRGALGTPEIARILIPVVDAVAAAHAQGFVHRDLKPENVFVTPSGDVKVLDFGIAKRFRDEDAEGTASLTSTGAIVGTPHYMAPEQVFDDTIDGRADVWALGVVLYECFAGVRPTEGVGFGQVLKRITTETLVPLGDARPGAPRAFALMVDRMLSRARDARPTLAAVRTMLDEQQRSPDALTLSERTPEPSRPSTTGEGTAEGLARTTHAGPKPGRTGLGFGLALVAGLAVAGALVIPKLRHAVPSPPGGVSADDIQRATDLAMRAVKHFELREGSACLADLDAHDALDTRPTSASTRVSSPYAERK